jgi:predicted membrane channel-forming protein YqfA (hemolysin III family)
MKKGNTKTSLIYFLLGMLVMFALDLIFHFNNSIDTQLKREMDKTQNKIENIFK